MPPPIFCRRLWAGLVALALLVGSAGLALAAPAGTVVGRFGSCFVESGGARSALQLGQAIQVADTVDVPADGKLKLRMADGSVISVAAGTRLTITAYATDAAGQRQDAQLSLGHGLVRAVVAPVERPARFEVDTAVGTAAVRSTDWFVEATATDMEVRVISGSVALTSAATKRTAMVRARMGSRLAAGHDPGPLRVWHRSEMNALIGRTRVARTEEHSRAFGRAHAGGPHRNHGGHAGGRPSGHKVEENRSRRGTAPGQPAGREPRIHHGK